MNTRLTEQLQARLLKASEEGSRDERVRRLFDASNLFDELASKGWVDKPSYNLAPMTTLPCKAHEKSGADLSNS